VGQLVYHVKSETRCEARRETFDFIEVFYNRQRMHSYLDHLSPVDFETAATKAA
jgi:putative transposase